MADAETTRDVAVMTDADAFAATAAVVVTTDAEAAMMAAVVTMDAEAATMAADVVMTGTENEGKTVAENAGKTVAENGKTVAESGKTDMNGIGMTAVDAVMNSLQDRCRRHHQDLRDLHLRIAGVIKQDTAAPAGNHQPA